MLVVPEPIQAARWAIELPQVFFPGASLGGIGTIELGPPTAARPAPSGAAPHPRQALGAVAPEGLPRNLP